MEHTWTFPNGMNPIRKADTDRIIRAECCMCQEDLNLPEQLWLAAIEAQTLDVPEIRNEYPSWWAQTGSKDFMHCSTKENLK